MNINDCCATTVLEGCPGTCVTYSGNFLLTVENLKQTTIIKMSSKTFKLTSNVFYQVQFALVIFPHQRSILKQIMAMFAVMKTIVVWESVGHVQAVVLVATVHLFAWYQNQMPLHVAQVKYQQQTNDNKTASLTIFHVIRLQKDFSFFQVKTISKTKKIMSRNASQLVEETG